MVKNYRVMVGENIQVVQESIQRTSAWRADTVPTGIITLLPSAPKKDSIKQNLLLFI